MIFFQYKQLYPKYFELNSKYLYGSVGKWLIVYKKVFFTKTDEDRETICDPTYAEYKTNKLAVKLIIEKQHPKITHKSITFDHYNESVIYTVGKTVKPIKSKLVFYKSYTIAYYTNLLNYSETKLSESYVSWFDNGRKSSEGQYLNGEMQGKWIFWYYLSNSLETNTKSFIGMYDNGILVEKTEYNL